MWAHFLFSVSSSRSQYSIFKERGQELPDPHDTEGEGEGGEEGVWSGFSWLVAAASFSCASDPSLEWLHTAQDTLWLLGMDSRDVAESLMLSPHLYKGMQSGTHEDTAFIQNVHASSSSCRPGSARIT